MLTPGDWPLGGMAECPSPPGTDTARSMAHASLGNGFCCKVVKARYVPKVQFRANVTSYGRVSNGSTFFES